MPNYRLLAISAIAALFFYPKASKAQPTFPETEPGTAPPVFPNEDLDLDPGLGDETVPPVPVNIEPSPNELFFPTVPEEVEIDITEPITLQQAITIAIRNNKDLQQTRLNLQRAQAQLEEAEAAYYPNLSTNVSTSYSQEARGDIQLDESLRNLRLRREPGTEQLTDEQIEVQSENLLNNADTDSYTLQGTVTLSQVIYAGGQRIANVRQAENQIRLQQLDVERSAAEITFEAARDYYNLQSADAAVEIAQAAVEDATQTLRDAQLLEQAGLGTRFDVLRAEVELSNANQQLTLAIATQRTARRQLAETLNVGQQVNISAADVIEVAGEWNLSLEESIILAYKNRAELEQFLVQREINEQQEEIALSAIRPRVNAIAEYNAIEVLDDDVGAGDGFTVAAQLQWTLYDGGAARASAKQEQIDQQIDENRFANLRDQIRLQVENSYYNLQANRENIRTATLAVELAQESLRLARLRFQAGVGTQTDVIQAQSELTTARANLLDAIIDYNLSLNELQRSITNLPDNLLFEVP